MVQAICDYVHEHLQFGYEHANPMKTAWQAHDEQRGVPRFSRILRSTVPLREYSGEILHRPLGRYWGASGT